MDHNLESAIDVQRQLTRGKRLLRHVWRHFQEDRCLEEAASLSYTSLLSMVPLLAVVFGIVAAFPVFNEWADRLQSFIFDNFMPETGEQIVPYLNTFLDSVTKLTLPGTMVLIVTALLLMIRIEVALNRIWRVDRNRTLVNRIVMYWAILTLGPLLIAGGIALSATKVMGVVGLDSGPSPGLARLGMFVLTWAFFSIMFLFVPNRSVRIKHALIGAFLSTVLFEVAKAGFVAYVSNANYAVIYGALATIPIFLFWLYIVWNVVLFGASLAASLTTFSDYTRYATDWPNKWEFQLAYRLLGHLWCAQLEGKALSRSELLELETRASELQIVRILKRMRDEQIVAMDEDGNFILSRDIGEMTLGELYRRGDYYLPLEESAELPQDTDWDRAYVDCLAIIHQRSGSEWTRSLKSMYMNNKTEGKP